MPHLVAACDDNVLRHWTMNKGPVAQHADLKKGAEFTASAAPMPELRGGHRGAVSAVTTYAPMSRRGEDPALNTPRIVSGSEDGTLRIWDASTGGPLARLAGHTAEVNAVCAFSVPGRSEYSHSKVSHCKVSHSKVSQSKDSRLRLLGALPRL